MRNAHNRRKFLRRDSPYILILSLCVGVPAYAVAGFTVYAFAAHLAAVALFLGTLYFSGSSYLVVDVVPGLLLAGVLALLGVAYQAQKDHRQINTKIQKELDKLPAPHPQLLTSRGTE